MTFKITAFLAAWLTFAFTFTHAQNSFNIRGTVAAADGRKPDGATIYLKREADSVLVKIALADTTGKYLLTGVKAGDYKLSVTMIGYLPYKSDLIHADKELLLPMIVLRQGGSMLREVAVTAQRPFVEHQIDRTVLNVDALISNAGSTALDVLEKSPGVIVDQNGAISLVGRSNVQIFVDDKPTYLSGADLENYLRSLPSSTIDQIELMTNPPAKYDAAGNGGIINIRTKKIKTKGFNGSINLAYTHGVYGRTNNSLNFNYRDNKFNFYGSLSYTTANNFNDLLINRYFENPDGSLASIFLQHSFIRRTAQIYNGRAGVDYYASAKTTLGIAFTGIYNLSDNNTLSSSRLLDAQNTLDSTVDAYNKQHNHFKNAGVNLNFRHEYDKKGRELTANLDYLNYSTGAAQSFNNVTFLPSGSITSNELLTGNLPAAINIFAAKADYSTPIIGGLKLLAGVKASYTKTDNIADYFNTIGGETTPNYDETNHFIYQEQINAGYINLNRDIKRWSVQAGLRFENTVSNGRQLGNVEKPDSVFKRNYNAFFPTVYIQYKLDTAGKQVLGLNYGRRIDRPYYADLNPFLSPLDKFTYYTGNPFLLPSFTQNIELSHTYKNITTTLSYSSTRDEVDETIEIVNGIYYSRPGNLGSTVTRGLSVDAGFDPAKWLNLHLFAIVNNIHTVSEFYTGPLNTQGTYYFIRPVLQFKMPNDWVAQLDASYQSKVISAQFIANKRYRANAALSKKLSPGTTIKLVVNDMFHSYVNSGTINNLANTLANYHNVSDTRTAVISLSYRFGRVISGQRQHDAHAAESEQNRVKN